MYVEEDRDPGSPETRERHGELEPYPFIVALGASAGGLEALTQVFEGSPGLTGMAVVIVMHLSADYKSVLPELLSRQTEMQVVHVVNGTVPMADCVYVIQPDTRLRYEAGRFHVAPAHKERGKLFLPINDFFESLAKERRSACAVGVLSGTGSDGATGLRAAKSCGAVTIAQSPDSARFDGMPRAAIATGAVDLVLTPDHVLSQLMQMRQEGQAHYFSAAAGHGELVMSRILFALRTHTNIDFSHYKPATIVRRVERRMKELNVNDAREYADRVFQDPAEAAELQQDLLIGVTRFMRDEGALDSVAKVALPRLMERAAQAPLRLWVAGCSTGEEAYSIAMLVQEGLDQLPSHQGFKMFATDVNPSAIEHASAGEFTEEALSQIPERLRDRYFKRRGDRFVVAKQLRERLLFSKHDLIQDPPFSRLDMVSCRNMLIYVKPAIQDRVLRLFGSALLDGGLLWLGSSEALGDQADDYEVLDARWRLYAARVDRRRPLVLAMPYRTSASIEPTPRKAKVDPMRPLFEALLKAYVPPCLVVDLNYRLMYRFGDIDALLRIPTGAVSLDVRDLLPEELSVLTSTLLSRARESADVIYRELQVQTPLGPRRFDLRARGLAVPGHGPLVALYFEGLRELDDEVETLSSENVAFETRDRIEMLERELRQSRESLQATIEEVESSNEELQATNEEMIAANEELQSTNEELQSVNEELHTVNAEFSQKLGELTELNTDLESLFASIEIGILMLDDRFMIRRYNATAASYFNILPHDVGRPLVHLSHRLRYSQMLDDCSQALAGKTAVTRRVVTAEGDQVQVRVRSHEGTAPSKRTVVVTLTDVTAIEGTQQQLGRLAVAVEQSPALITVIGPDDRVIHANRAFAQAQGREFNGSHPTSVFDITPATERDRLRDALTRTRAGSRWRGVVRSRRADGSDAFELVRLVPATANDLSIVRIGEPLVNDFIPYDRDRRQDEPGAIGPLLYCVWSAVNVHRVLDERLLELLDLESLALFDPTRADNFAVEEDVPVLRELVRAPDGRALFGFRFRVRGAGLPRTVQLRVRELAGVGEEQRVLLELAELANVPAGYRSRVAQS